MASNSSKPKNPIHRAITYCDEVCRECQAYERLLPAAFLAGILLALCYVAFLSAPRDFATPAIIRVKADETLAETAQNLQDQHVVRYGFLFEGLARAFGGNRKIREGSYFFASGQNIFAVALRFITGDFELNPVRIYVPEGSTSTEIAAILKDKLAPFDDKKFLEIAKPREGYLYPDTYFFFPAQEPQVVERAMESNFNKHVATIAPQIAAFNKPLPEILTMASILVGEAGTSLDRQTVAGILWKRIKIGMPLQVDAPFGYVLDKRLTDLTSKDLQMDSPYNTYKNKGLPPTPINNPALGAIEAAVTPISSNYLFYLSDGNGKMHYSATYMQHVNKINTYLK